MQARRTLSLVKKGAKKFLEYYDGQLVCACYRHKEQRPNRLPPVEIIVEESGWSPPSLSDKWRAERDERVRRGTRSVPTLPTTNAATMTGGTDDIPLPF